MQTLYANGARLTAKLFIDYYAAAGKLSPPRFLTLRLHPDKYKELYVLADIPMSIQMGYTLGPMGRQEMRVTCIKPPLGVANGVAIVQDDTVDPTQLIFQIHGIAELVVENLAYDAPAKSPTSTSVN
jgi:hypothetical protein